MLEILLLIIIGLILKFSFMKICGVVMGFYIGKFLISFICVTLKN